MNRERPGQATGQWHAVTLGDVADIVMGQSPPGDTVSSDRGLALLNGPTEFGAHHPTPVQFTTDARRRAQPGDLLFCVRGSTTGRMNWADQEYAIGRGVAAIHHRHHPALQPFVRGVIESELPELLTQATGSTFPNVSAHQLAEIPYPQIGQIRAARHRPCTRHAGRQDRAEPPHERHSGGDGAGALQVLVRRLRAGARQDGRPLAARRIPARPARRALRPVPGPAGAVGAGGDTGGVGGEAAGGSCRAGIRQGSTIC